MKFRQHVEETLASVLHILQACVKGDISNVDFTLPNWLFCDRRWHRLPTSRLSGVFALAEAPRHAVATAMVIAIMGRKISFRVEVILRTATKVLVIMLQRSS